MKKSLYLSFLILCLSQISFAQEIRAFRKFGGVRFETDTTTLGLNQVLDIVRENPEAYAELKRARLNYNMAGVLGFAGGILIGFPIGTAIAGGNPEWGLAAGGAALILSSIPFTRAFRSRTVNALDIYNSKYTAVIKPELQFYGNGVKLILRF